jgi:hypothetical protein
LEALLPRQPPRPALCQCQQLEAISSGKQQFEANAIPYSFVPFPSLQQQQQQHQQQQQEGSNAAAAIGASVASLTSDEGGASGTRQQRDILDINFKSAFVRDIIKVRKMCLFGLSLLFAFSAVRASTSSTRPALATTGP